MKPIARVLLLLPLRNAERQIGYYFTALEQLTYPASLLSIGLLESDSADDTFIRVQRRLPALSARYRHVQLWKKDFEWRVAQTDPPEPVHIRRARIRALSHNHLLFRALDDEDYVLWLNVDTYEYPPDIVERLLATGKDIVEPRWLTVDDGEIVDRSPWLGQTKSGFETASAGDAVIPVETLGGSMLLIRADVHRDGLVFPPFTDGVRQPEPRQHLQDPDFGALVPVARAMGYECCAMPNTEVRSFDMRYSSIVSRIVAAVADVVAPGNVVLVASKGDPALIAFSGAIGWHFPQADDGSFLHWNPPDSAAAIAYLEHSRARGAHYLLIPATAFWWLDHYAEFAKHLRTKYRPILERLTTCLIFHLEERAS